MEHVGYQHQSWRLSCETLAQRLWHVRQTEAEPGITPILTQLVGTQNIAAGWVSQISDSIGFSYMKESTPVQSGETITSSSTPQRSKHFLLLEKHRSELDIVMLQAEHSYVPH